MTKKGLLICTTVADTLQDILVGQPKFLSHYFTVSICSANKDKLDTVGCKESVSTIYVDMERGISPFKDIYSLYKMIGCIRSFSPDILHSYTPKAGLLCALAGYICRVPVRIHTFTGLLFPSAAGFTKKMLMFMDKILCVLVTHVVAEGACVKNDLLEAKITSKKIHIIGNGNIAGIDHHYFDPDYKLPQLPALKNWQLNTGHKSIFLYIGRLTEEKGIYELRSAFERLSREFAVALWVVGDLDERLPPPNSFLYWMNNTPNVEYFGYQSDIRQFLKNCDCLVLPSYREGFPNVLLQAGAMAKPCLASDVNGAREIIKEGENGFLFSAKDAESLYQVQKRFVYLADEIKIVMGKAARENVLKLYRRDNYQRQLYSFYKEVLSGDSNIH